MPVDNHSPDHSPNHSRNGEYSANYTASTVQPALITGDSIELGVTHPLDDKGDIKYPVMSVSLDGVLLAFDRKAADMLFRFIYNERNILFPNGQTNWPRG